MAAVLSSPIFMTCSNIAATTDSNDATDRNELDGMVTVTDSLAFEHRMGAL